MLHHAIDKADRVLVVTHVDPDGDAIGSLTAMGQALKQQGKRVTLACDDAVPKRFAFLPMSDEVVSDLNGRGPFSLLIALDCGDEFRMGSFYTALSEPRPTTINIDHHVTNTYFGDINLIDGKATSTTEILYALFREMEVDITPDIAASLLTGLVTDTLGFRTLGVTADTLRIAADLVNAGANLADVTTKALTMRNMETIQLWRTGLNNMHFEDGLAWTSISDRERQAIGFRSSSSVGLVNLMADVDVVCMSAVVMEMNDGIIRVGLRCRPPYDVAEVALAFGGGGHALAAGCALDGPLEKAEAIIVTACKAAIQRQAAEAGVKAG